MNLNQLYGLDLDFLSVSDRKMFYAMAKKEINGQCLTTGVNRVKPMTGKQTTQYHRILNSVIDYYNKVQQ